MQQSLLRGIKAIVFDLDNTLIDHAFAEKEAMMRVLAAYTEHTQLGELFRSTTAPFLAAYRRVNETLWLDFAFRRISGEELKWMRFAKTLQTQVPSLTEAEAITLGKEMGAEYMRLYREHWRVLEGANALLDILKDRFKLGVITNGFTEQQRGKLAQFAWQDLFHTVVLSEEVGVMKPHREIFTIAEKQLECLPEELLYVGDNYVSDIEGAHTAGWRTVWLQQEKIEKPESLATACVQSLPELQELLKHG
ncbi:MAG: HAD family hydrolase [Candidatus Kapaibacterium sp.]|nr:MAG: HAD family hydrolase [Candidatus Kapabacteria bacterium]